MKNYYQFLGLEPSATFEQVRKAYRDYAKRFHPDKHGDDPFFKERFQEIEAAHYTLSDAKRRAEYDKTFFKKEEPVSAQAHTQSHSSTYSYQYTSQQQATTNSKGKSSEQRQGSSAGKQTTSTSSSNTAQQNETKGIHDNWGYPIFFVIGMIFLGFGVYFTDKLGITDNLLNTFEFNGTTKLCLLASGILGMVWYHYQD